LNGNSGHAASSFTVASMLDEYYGPNVGIPAYVLALLFSILIFRFLFDYSFLLAVCR
jgi:hypothetical protein